MIYYSHFQIENTVTIWGFTGHRPPGLVDDPYDVWIYYPSKILPRLVDLGKGIIEKHNVEYAVIGMALGFDTGMGIACVQLGIPYLAAVPGEWFWNKMFPTDRERYSLLLEHADKVVYVEDLDKYRISNKKGFDVIKLHKRNEFIVDKCDVLGALWNGTPSGTGSTIQYAKKCDKDYNNFWKSWESGRDLPAKSTTEIRRMA